MTPVGQLADDSTAIVLGRTSGSVCVARTCSTSLVPMPNASAPNAPWVLVWLSPQTTVMPGWVRPSCGPMTCTMPWSASPIGCSRTPNSAQFLRSASICWRLIGSVDRAVSGRDVVVLGGDGEVRTSYGAAGGAQAVEGLRAGHLVDQVQVDVEQVRLVVGACARHARPRPSLQGFDPRWLLLMPDLRFAC